MRSSSLTLSPATVAPDGSFIVSVTVKNSGSRVGQEVVQVYATDLVSSVVTPNQELVGFQKVSLAYVLPPSGFLAKTLIVRPPRLTVRASRSVSQSV